MKFQPYQFPLGEKKSLGRLVLPVLVAVFIGTLLLLTRQFYYANTILVPSRGGTYIEGSVGKMQPLMPWFTVTNDVNRDIVSLVFSGLLRYDPDTNRIEDDLASLIVSEGGLHYTVRLKKDLTWHDHSDEHPHYVTSDDILFTFQTIQDPEFPNQILRQNFLGVTMEKVDKRAVRFILEEPYSFFASNLTLGLLPKRHFDHVPVAKLDQAIDFGFNPIGAGPYKFKSVVPTELSTEITLERFNRPMEPVYKLDQVIFRIFSDYSTLLSDIRNLDGVRLVPRNDGGSHLIPRHFIAHHYSLPQYVALFFNQDREVLKDQKLRLGLQKGTDKESLVSSIGESLIVDTPLLELDDSDWRYFYDPEAAQGALFESNWHLPEKVRLQRLLEIHDANRIGSLQIDPIVLLDTGAILTVTGSFVDAESGSTLNGLPVAQHDTQTGAWIVGLPTHGGTGSLSLGMNLVRLVSSNDEPIDSFYVWRTDSSRDYRRAAVEQEIMETFLQTKAGKIEDEESRITIGDLYLEKGMLRKRLSTDPRDIRINDAGDKLSLTLLTSPSPPQYKELATEIQSQWKELGVHVGIVVPETREEFEEKLLSREYDMLLFGQSLLDNLDSYPYWHSSGMQKMTDSKFDLRIDAYNLSQYTSIAADGLLEVIRATYDEKERTDALEKLRDILKDDIPAIFLYSPQYTFASDRDVNGMQLGSLSMHSDRFLSLHHWYIKQERVFKPGKNWWSIFGWVLRQE